MQRSPRGGWRWAACLGVLCSCDEHYRSARRIVEDASPSGRIQQRKPVHVSESESTYGAPRGDLRPLI